MTAERHKQLVAAAEELLDLWGYTHFSVKNYRCFKCGQVQNAPAKDIADIMCYHPVMLAIEVKTGAAKLSKGQERFRDLWTQAGGHHIELHDNVDELIKWRQAWQDRS